MRTVLFSIAALLAFPSAVNAQQIIEDAPDPYVHAAVSVEFPLVTDRFTRSRVIEYNAQGTDASAGYSANDFPSPIEMTVYIYPAHSISCEEEFVQTVNGLASTSGFQQSGASLPMESESFEGVEQYHASFEVDAGAFGVNHPRLESRLWIACPANRDLRVKIRATYEEGDAVEARAFPAELLDSLDWSSLLD